MQFSTYHMQVNFTKIKQKKFQILFFGTLLIMIVMNCSGSDQMNFSYSTVKGFRHDIKLDSNYNTGKMLNLEPVKNLKENKLTTNSSNHKRHINSKKISELKIKQAFTLCQISREYWQNDNIEKAIDLLDQAYSLILRTKTYGCKRLLQQKENVRFLISKRIHEIYASRKINIKGAQTEIRVTLNEKVKHEIELYTNSNIRKYFIDSYKRSGKYRSMIVDLLRKANLPEELSWLPLVESGFSVNAISRSKALGLWQFIPSTGYKFGLNRNRYIDERLDPIKSTQAAIGYLKELHNHFGDWSTALAAYNCGENRVLRIIKNQKVNYLDDFWDLYDQLPRETARYVPKFLAVLHIVKNLKKYDLDKIEIDPPLEFETLTVAKKIALKEIAQITGIHKKILEQLNPELKRKIVPNGNYALKVPIGSKQELFASQELIFHLNSESVAFLKHRVRSGESLSLIASRYDTSVGNIMLANNLNRADHLTIGQLLKVPKKGKISGFIK